jgi:glycosyltransferase involved in cell wall biosynthesis
LTHPFGTPGRRKILFVGHEATRTGAPLILLTLMEAAARLTDAELFLVLGRDGPLLDAYVRFAHVLIDRDEVLYGDLLAQLVHEIANPAPEIAICNSAGTWRLIDVLRRGNFPHIVFLAHERMSFYPAEVAGIVHRHADRVIFPADTVKKSAERFLPQYRNADVIPQGLLKDAFGFRDKSTARKTIRNELRLAADTRIVLCCGVREPRKGLDLFVQLAARVRSQTSSPVHFLWLGGDEQPTEFKRFVRHDISLLGLDGALSFVAETADPEPYFLAADVYALTSRDDPFPCVVQEAMACALPVIAFDRAGGASEALADDCGIIVPYLDIDAMAHHVRSVVERPADFVRLGRNAERRVRSGYRFSDYARRVLEICQDVVDSRPSIS